MSNNGRKWHKNIVCQNKQKDMALFFLEKWTSFRKNDQKHILISFSPQRGFEKAMKISFAVKIIAKLHGSFPIKNK